MNKIKEINLSEYVEGWERGGDPLFIYVYNNISERKWDVKKLESRMKAKEEREREGGRGERKWGHKNPFKRYRWGQQWCLFIFPWVWNHVALTISWAGGGEWWQREANFFWFPFKICFPCPSIYLIHAS